MGIIKLNNIQLYAFHGCMPEEAVIGSQYRVDLKVKAPLRQSAISDNLLDTTDYVALNQIVKQEMHVRSELLETVAQRIVNRILKEHTAIKKVRIEIAKINPPIGGHVESVSVKMSQKQNSSKKL